MNQTCESCGSDEPELWAVHRRYVTVEAWDTPASDRVLDEIEHWCFACCTHYPHSPGSASGDLVSDLRSRPDTSGPDSSQDADAR